MICIDVEAVDCCRYDGPKIQRIKNKEYMVTYKGCRWFNDYFPDYEPKQLPERQFIYSNLGAFGTEELKIMVEGVRKNRALKEEKPADDFIYVEKELYDEISNVITHKVSLTYFKHL